LCYEVRSLREAFLKFKVFAEIYLSFISLRRKKEKKKEERG